MEQVKITCCDCLITTEKNYLEEIPYFQEHTENEIDLSYEIVNPITLIKVIDFYKNKKVEFDESDYETLKFLGIEKPLECKKNNIIPDELNIDILTACYQNEYQPPKRIEETVQLPILFDYNTIKKVKTIIDNSFRLDQFYTNAEIYGLEKGKAKIEFNQLKKMRLNPKGDLLLEFQIYVYNYYYPIKTDENIFKEFRIVNANNQLLCKIEDDLIEQYNFKNFTLVKVKLYSRFPYCLNKFSEIFIDCDVFEKYQNKKYDLNVDFVYTSGLCYKEPHDIKNHSIIESEVGECRGDTIHYLFYRLYRVFEFVIILEEGSYKDIKEVNCLIQAEKTKTFSQIDIYFGRKNRDLPDNVVVIPTPFLTNQYLYSGCILIGFKDKDKKIKKVYSNWYNELKNYDDKYVSKLIM